MYAPVTKTSVSGSASVATGSAGSARLLDIVNGFLNRCRGAWHSILRSNPSGRSDATQDIVKCNLAEIIVPPVNNAGFYAGLSLMVWILKREVRAFGGCLGMYRR